MSEGTSTVVEGCRTIVALVAMLCSMVLLAHLSSTLAVATGFEQLTTGEAGRVLFAVSAAIALVTVFDVLLPPVLSLELFFLLPNAS